MQKSVAVFDFSIDIHGARITVAREPICSACLSDIEVDTQIELLKQDLDYVSIRMKTAIRQQKKKSLF